MRSLVTVNWATCRGEGCGWGGEERGTGQENIGRPQQQEAGMTGEHRGIGKLPASRPSIWARQEKASFPDLACAPPLLPCYPSTFSSSPRTRLLVPAGIQGSWVRSPAPPPSPTHPLHCPAEVQRVCRGEEAVEKLPQVALQVEAHVSVGAERCRCDHQHQGQPNLQSKPSGRRVID